MKLIVNGAAQDVNSDQVEALLLELGYENMIVATAVNGVFCPHHLRALKQLCEHDQVEILAPMQGG